MTNDMSPKSFWERVRMIGTKAAQTLVDLLLPVYGAYRLISDVVPVAASVATGQVGADGSDLLAWKAVTAFVVCRHFLHDLKPARVLAAQAIKCISALVWRVAKFILSKLR